MADKFSSTWEDKLLMWSESMKEDCEIECQIQDEIKNLKEERELMEDATTESVYNLYGQKSNKHFKCSCCLQL